jgi:hypothetical protein
VDLLRLKPPALRGFVATDCDSDMTAHLTKFCALSSNIAQERVAD